MYRYIKSETDSNGNISNFTRVRNITKNDLEEYPKIFPFLNGYYDPKLIDENKDDIEQRLGNLSDGTKGKICFWEYKHFTGDPERSCDVYIAVLGSPEYVINGEDNNMVVVGVVDDDVHLTDPERRFDLSVNEATSLFKQIIKYCKQDLGAPFFIYTDMEKVFGLYQ